MKNKYRLITLFIVLLILVGAAPTAVSAAPIQDDRTVFGETYTLESGRTLNGNLNVFGGMVTIEEDATVNGNTFVMGGLVTIDGTIMGDLAAIGGTVTLEDDAVIKGNLFAPASYINEDENAIVEGERRENWDMPWGEITMPRFSQWSTSYRPGMMIVPTINRIGKAIALTLVMAGLGALLLLIMPESTERMVKALVASPWQVLGYGALTAVVVFVASLILTVTICLIPVAFLILLTFGLAILAGWLVLGYELGRRILTGMFHTKWSPALTALFGNAILYLIASGLNLIPCVGGFLVFIAVFFGLGTVVVTLFGTKSFPRDEVATDDGQVVLFDNDKNEDLTPIVDAPEITMPDTEPDLDDSTPAQEE